MHHYRKGRLRPTAGIGLTLSLIGTLFAVPTAAASASPAAPTPAPAADPTMILDPQQEPAKDTVDPRRRDEVLRDGWRKSGDVAWTLNGDADGLHVLAATARSGYTWETVTTLAEPGFEADAWIGNACLTGSGRRLVVVYAPRTFTNKPDLFDRGGFTAAVDLKTGAVTKLAVQTSLAYYNPGCGAGEKAVLSQYGGERVDDPDKPVQSRVFTLDAANGKLSEPIVLDTELSSPVPVGDKVVAAGGGSLVEVDRSAKIKRLAATDGVPFRLVPDASGNVTFMDSAKDRVRVKRLARKAGAKPAKLAEGPPTELGLTRGSGGKAFVTGTATDVATLPTGVRRIAVPANSELSATGDLALTRVRAAGAEDPRLRPADPAAADPVRIDAKVPTTGSAVQFDVVVEGDQAATTEGREPSPALGAAAGQARVAASAGSPSEASEGTDERYCAVPRNDPQNQAVQPKPRQVEWAVDQVVTGTLGLRRPANWKNLGMPEYTLGQYFPRIELVTGGRVPPQILLGVIAQESNMWQAARYALPGVTANPLIGNFYGRDIYNNNEGDDWDINWADADCGYGLTQVTDGMRLAGKEKTDDKGNKVETSLPYQQQRAIALDFAANVAAGARILQEKWNQTYNAGLTVHNADPAHMENWFFALWAYNSGFYPEKAGEPWGVGWLNNPINPRYDPQRKAFLEYTYDDARNPQRWPYPEKVLGWAGHPIVGAESPTTDVAGYRPAWWTSTEDRIRVKPDPKIFCNESNDCDPTVSVKPDDPDVVGEPAGPCLHMNSKALYDLRCWYHEPVAWKGSVGSPCATCGYEILRFDPGYEYQADGVSFPPKCDTAGLLQGARVIDNIEKSQPIARDCARNWTDGGKFSLNFAADAKGLYPSKVDLHQIGAGFGAHLWRGHTRKPGHLGGKLKITGTWQLAESMTGWTRIQVSVPDHGAWSQQAKYVINLGNGQTRYRVVNQTWQENRWVDLGVFPLAGRASVSLTNETADGMGSDSIVFDAVAFTPTTKPAAQYVALGDSYSSGEGTKPYDRNSDLKRGNGGPTDKNACHRSAKAYPRLVKLPGQDKTIEQQAAEGKASFAFIACSGATTVGVATEAVNSPPAASDTGGHTDWGSAEFQHGEMTQVDQGYLDADTTHVTLSVGGNDARFAEVLRGCILRLADGCELDDYKLTRNNGKVDPEPLFKYETKLIRDWLPAKLKATYRAIHRRAPNAQIVVVGYPQMRPDEEPNGTCFGMSGPTQVFLNELTHHLTAASMKAVSEVYDEGVKIRYVNSTLKWRLISDGGKHWACQNLLSGEDDTRWTEAVLGQSEDGSGNSDPGTGSWHPNDVGQRQFASMVSSVWRGDSSVAAIKQRIINYVDTRKGERWTITPDQAEDAARRCLDLTRRGGMFDDPCMNIAIFFPTVGDAGSAAHNDEAGLKRYPAWVVQNYASRTHEKIKSWAESWMNEPRFGQTACPSPRPKGPNGEDQACDEFPYYSSEQGVAWAHHTGGETQPISSQLRLISATENSTEGRILGGMYSKTECKMTSAVWDSDRRATPWRTPELIQNGSPFLAIPLLADVHKTNKTFYVC